jgi:Na+/melibiose symporter-like transporter
MTRTLEASADASTDGSRRLPVAQGGRVPWSMLTAYGLLGLPMAAQQLPLYVFLPPFYAEDLGVGLAAVGAALLAARLFDMVTDPLVGWLSDRTGGRFGRRKPWILAGTPLLLVSIWYLFVPPQDAGWVHLMVWTMIAYLGGTLLVLAHQAWGAELSPAYHQRSRIAMSRELFAVIGTVATVLLLMGTGGDTAEVMVWIAWGFTISLPLTVLLALWRVPDTHFPQRRSAFELRRGLRLLASNRPFRQLIGAYFLNGVANGMPASLFLLYIGHVLQPEQEAWKAILLLAYFLSAVLAVPLWLQLSYRFGKDRTWIVSIVWACLVFVWVPFLGEGDLWWFLAIVVLSGVSLGADQALPSAMQADVIDLDRLKSGRQRAGLYFALWGMANKLSLALAAGLTFPLLELFGFDPQAETNTETALFALAALYALLPVVFKVASIWTVWRYPIDPATQDRIRRLIQKRELDRK